MTKTPDNPEDSPPAGRRREILVRSSSGSRHPFLRGMLTHDLVQRGLSFDAAYAAARAVRSRIAKRGEISTSELRDIVEEQLARMLPVERLARLGPPVRPAPEITVVYHDEPQPFSRGLLARSMQAAGLDLDRAYLRVTELQGELRGEGVKRLDSDELARRAGDLLESSEGIATAARYRSVRGIRRLPRPLILYLGGASGTGKSTLALDLAPLLRVYRINATDTVRQVMRMVFSPEILPAIHRSSFEEGPSYPLGFPEAALEAGSPEAAERARHAFEEQATRIAVGVRALVDRAVTENMSIIVEGVHLVPPMIPFADLQGAAYQIALMLTTLDEDIHRARFLARERTTGRHGRRYLEHFPGIRRIHDFLLDQAELHDVPLVETTDRDATLEQSLRLVTEMLERHLPGLGGPGAAAPRPVPTLLLVIDGLGDQPTRALAGRTPLQAARTPTLDRLAREGRIGLADPVAPGVVPDTASGSLAIFGQSPRALKRGPVEAMGTDIGLAPGDIALRGNFATLDAEGRVIDRRAGRIREGAAELAEALDRLPLSGEDARGVTVRVSAGTEHRLAVVLKGRELSSDIVGSDPGDGAPPGPPLVPQGIDPGDERAARTARLLAAFEEKARWLLAEHPVNAERRSSGLSPADTVLTRGAGHIHRLAPLEHAGVPLGLACIGGDRTVLGLAAWLGAEVIGEPGMTGNLDTDLAAKLAAAQDALEHRDLVVVHVKGADIAAHDRRPDLKVEFLERLDRRLDEFVEAREAPLRIAVAADHATLSEAGQHAADPVPVLIWGPGIEADEAAHFDEQTAVEGSLERFPLQHLLGLLFEGARK